MINFDGLQCAPNFVRNAVFVDHVIFTKDTSSISCHSNKRNRASNIERLQSLPFSFLNKYCGKNVFCVKMWEISDLVFLACWAKFKRHLRFQTCTIDSFGTQEITSCLKSTSMSWIDSYSSTVVFAEDAYSRNFKVIANSSQNPYRNIIFASYWLCKSKTFSIDFEIEAFV